MSLIRNKTWWRLHTDTAYLLLLEAGHTHGLTLVVLNLHRHDVGAVIVAIVSSRVGMTLRQVVTHDQASLTLSLNAARVIVVRRALLVLEQEVVRLPIS